jgi:hypothetical protein
VVQVVLRLSSDFHFASLSETRSKVALKQCNDNAWKNGDGALAINVAVTVRCHFEGAVTVRCYFDQAVTVRWYFDQAVTVR